MTSNLSSNLRSFGFKVIEQSQEKLTIYQPKLVYFVDVWGKWSDLDNIRKFGSKLLLIWTGLQRLIYLNRELNWSMNTELDK